MARRDSGKATRANASQDRHVIQKVLIVDDSKLARMAVIKALNALHPDWTRLEASNADEALELVERMSPDVVLLDFNMPGKDGLILAAELRESNPRVRVAVISANRQIEVIDRAHAAGAAFLPKPLTEKALGDFLNTPAQQS
jgi:DNA-binding NarL/FixJ family response regulator